MKAVIEWVLAHRYRPVLLAIAFSPLVPVISAALMALETTRRGAAQGAIGALFVFAGVALVELVTSGGIGLLSAVAVAAALSGVAIGSAIAWAGSLNLGFQGAVLLCFVAGVLVTLAGPAPEVMFEPVIEQLVEMLDENGATPQQLEAVRGLDAVLMGLVVAAIFAQVAAGLLLAYWWLSLMRDDVAFGPEFRELKLGKVLGIPAMALVTAGLVLETPLVQNLTPLALFAFLFQGLAVMHAWAHAKSWHPALVGVIYVLFVTPLTGLTIMGLSVVGLLDNVFELRSPLRART